MADYVNVAALREYEERHVIPFINAAAASYLRQFGTLARATEAAEADVLGMAMGVAEFISVLDSMACKGLNLTERVALDTAAAKARAVLAWKAEK